MGNGTGGTRDQRVCVPHCVFLLAVPWRSVGKLGRLTLMMITDVDDPSQVSHYGGWMAVLLPLIVYPV